MIKRNDCLNDIKVTDLTNNKKAIITRIDIEDKILKTRLLDLGFVKDTIISIQRTPFGDPIIVNIKGYKLCVRKNILSRI